MNIEELENVNCESEKTFNLLNYVNEVEHKDPLDHSDDINGETEKFENQETFKNVNSVEKDPLNIEEWKNVKGESEETRISSGTLQTLNNHNINVYDKKPKN